MISFLVKLYVLSIVCFQVVIRSPLRSLWLVQLVNTFGVWYYLPLIFLLPLALLKSRRVTVWLFIPTLIFGLEYSWALIPQWTVGNNQPALRVMTWNLWNKNPSPEAVRDIILSQQPDIVALQELVDTMASPLRDELRATYPYQEIGRSAALGIFSRYPLQAVHNSTTEVKACRCPEVVVSWQEQQVRFINVHLPTPTLRISRSGPFPAITAFNSSKQGRWLDGLMQRMSGIGPLLVSGDFNIGDRQLNYDRLRTQLSDAFLEAGWGFGLSYPVNRLTRFPVVRIDYILHSKDWKATQAAVSEGLGV